MDTVEMMRIEKIDYLILDSHYIKKMHNYISLWENPTKSEEFGLILIIAENDLFQIYSLK